MCRIPSLRAWALPDFGLALTDGVDERGRGSFDGGHSLPDRWARISQAMEIILQSKQM